LFTFDFIFVALLLTVTLLFLAFGRFSADTVFLTALGTLLVSGILTPNEALVGRNKLINTDKL